MKLNNAEKAGANAQQSTEDDVTTSSPNIAKPLVGGSTVKLKYSENESFIHKYAKELLAKKLSEINKNNDSCEFKNIKWRSNYGVFTELKFYETSNPYYFELSDGLVEHTGFDENNIDKRGKNPLDWFDKNYNRGKILFVPDITIFHKGTPTIFIEIVHTHHLEQKKINAIEKFFEGHLIQVYEISARQILGNTTDELIDCEFMEAFVS
jgi:hypothetical protein